MAIKFSGEFEVKRKPEEVYEFLTDPNRFAPLLPDFEGVSVEDATHFTVKVKVGISYIKGTAHVKLELSETDHPRRAQYKGQGSSPVATLPWSPGLTCVRSQTEARQEPQKEPRL